MSLLPSLCSEVQPARVRKKFKKRKKELEQKQRKRIHKRQNLLLNYFDNPSRQEKTISPLKVSIESP